MYFKSSRYISSEKKSAFNEISLSNTIIARRINDIGENIEEQLQSSKRFADCSLALDESTAVNGTAQRIFICGITQDFNVTEELLSLKRLKDSTRGIGIFETVCRALDTNNINLNSIT